MRRLLRRLGAAVLLLLIVDYFFFSYFRNLDFVEQSSPVFSDAVVVFSGDPARIKRAFDILERGFAPRLFIAGLDNGAEVDAERKRLPTLSACCIERKQASRNTHEDALAIATWARSHEVRSLIVVTTNIHMPRALMELGGMVPEVTLAPVAVSKGLYDSSDWRHDVAIWPRLAQEAIKYAFVRCTNVIHRIGY